MSTNRFRLNNHSNVAHKSLDLSAQLPLAPGTVLYTEEIPAGPWRSRGMQVILGTLDSQIQIITEVSFDRKTPRKYSPAFHPVLGTQLTYSVASTPTDKGSFSQTIDFDGDWVRYSIVNTGSNPISDLDFIVILADAQDMS